MVEKKLNGIKIIKKIMNKRLSLGSSLCMMMMDMEDLLLYLWK
jgi:hypothetical protein